VIVSKLFGSAMRTAIAAAAATGGLVDPTLGPALTAAGYDRDFSLLDGRDERPPGPTAPGPRSCSPPSRSRTGIAPRCRTASGGARTT
jgi:thiamine biosynthesis lipoprotein